MNSFFSKKISLLSILLISLCNIYLFAQNQNTSITKKNYAIEKFSHIKLQGNFIAKIYQDANQKQKLILQIPANFTENFRISSKKDTLIVKTPRNYPKYNIKKDTLIVAIYTPTLSSIHSTLADISFQTPINTKSLDISAKKVNSISTQHDIKVSSDFIIALDNRKIDTDSNSTQKKNILLQTINAKNITLYILGSNNIQWKNIRAREFTADIQGKNSIQSQAIRSRTITWNFVNNNFLYSDSIESGELSLSMKKNNSIQSPIIISDNSKIVLIGSNNLITDKFTNKFVSRFIVTNPQQEISILEFSSSVLKIHNNGKLSIQNAHIKNRLIVTAYEDSHTTIKSGNTDFAQIDLSKNSKFQAHNFIIREAEITLKNQANLDTYITDILKILKKSKHSTHINQGSPEIIEVKKF